MKPEDYFKPGTVAFVQAQEAINIINAAKAAGLPEAEQYERSFMSSMDLVKNNQDWSGFDANRKAVSVLAPQVQKFATENNETASKADSISATIRMLNEKGVKTSPEEINNIANAVERGDKPFLTQKANMLASQLGKLAESQLPPTPAEQAKIDLDTQALATAKQKLVADKQEADNAKYSLEETLKDKYKSIIDVKTNPDIKSAFGIPISRLIPGTESSSLSAKVNQIANKEWIDSIIKSKAAGATFGSLTEKEGAKLASAATLLSAPSDLNYETANNELLKMAESVKKLYRKSTGREITDDLKLASPESPDEMTPQQKADAKAAQLSGILSGAPIQ